MSQVPDQKEIQALAKLEGNEVVVVGNKVYDASQLVPSVVPFTRLQYLFLQNYRLGVPLETAAAKSSMTTEDAEKFLSRPKTLAWLQDRAVKDHIRNEWAEGSKWWKMGDEVLNGEKHLSKDQQVVYMAFGERVCPKPRISDDEKATTVINFNFSKKDVIDAFRREEALDAEIAEGGA